VSTNNPEFPSKNSWLKNTYFWIAAILFVLGLVGLVMGDGVIRDPGQRHENKLWAIYLVSSVVMLINGYISHQTWLKQFESQSAKD
jgi:hypothetical protein